MITTETLLIRIGISSLDRMRDRTLAFAKGERVRDPDEPKVWFTSVEDIAKMFSAQNMLLLETLRNSEPLSVPGDAAELGTAVRSWRRCGTRNRCP